MATLPKSHWCDGSHLSAVGWSAYPSLFEEAVLQYNMEWLAKKLNHAANWVPYGLLGSWIGSVRCAKSGDAGVVVGDNHPHATTHGRQARWSARLRARGPSTTLFR